MTDPASVPGWKKWLILARVWGAPISIVPLVMGTALAALYGGVRVGWGRFALALVAIELLHSGANAWSDVFDFRRGLDRKATPVSGALSHGVFTLRQTVVRSLGMLAAGAAIGAGLALRAGPALWWVGNAGLLLALFYFLFKPVALGDLAVFAAFGPLIALGAWVLQTGAFSWLPLVWLVPFGLIVIAVLHANNWRDTDEDRAAGIRTVAQMLGDRGSFVYYGALVFGSIALTLVFLVMPVAGQTLPWGMAVVLLTVPPALKLMGRARRRHAPRQPLDFVTLDAATAQFMVPFGVLSTLGLLTRLLGW